MTSAPKAAPRKARKIGKALQKGKPLWLRFSTQDQIVFAKRLGMILRSGMPIMEGLSILGSGQRSSSAAYIFDNLTQDVRSGQPLSVGLERFVKIFGRFCISIIRVGEASGTLHENLEYLAEELKKKQALRRKVVGALIYPAVIIFATLGITVLLTVYIFPKILPIFKSVGATLPFSTRALIAISAFLSNWGLWLLLAIVILIIAFFFSMRYPRFHYIVDVTLLRLPLLGKLSLYYNVANISRTLSLLLRSGAPIVQSVELVAASTRNKAYERSLQAVASRLLRGQKIANELAIDPKLYPPLMTQMIFVGESTGNLPGTLAYISEMYEEEINELTKNLTTLLEPALMIVMGIIVGFVAISIITPIYSITQSLSPH